MATTTEGGEDATRDDETDAVDDTEAEPGQGQDREREPCASCGELIVADASVCPECDNNPAKTAKWSSIGLMGAGFFLSLTGVGAIVGVPMFIVGLVARIGMRWVDYPATKYGWG